MFWFKQLNSNGRLPSYQGKVIWSLPSLTLNYGTDNLVIEVYKYWLVWMTWRACFLGRFNMFRNLKSSNLGSQVDNSSGAKAYQSCTAIIGANVVNKASVLSVWTLHWLHLITCLCIFVKCCQASRGHNLINFTVYNFYIWWLNARRQIAVLHSDLSWLARRAGNVVE